MSSVFVRHACFDALEVPALEKESRDWRGLHPGSDFMCLAPACSTPAYKMISLNLHSDLLWY